MARPSGTAPTAARTTPPITCGARRTWTPSADRHPTRRRAGRSRTSARNRYDEKTHTLAFSAAQTEAFRKLVPYYSRFFSDPKSEHGLLPHAITDPRQLRQLTAFFAWTAWAAAANRPGHNYSYTNNWPPEPRVDNGPTANVIVWSVLSLIALLGGIGLLFAASGRWGGLLGWHGREQATLSFRAPGDVALTPAQRATAWFFFVMAALFLVQTFVGAASQHYRAEIDTFFGFDLARWFPYNLMRTWHVQLAIFWVATSFVAAGIFLASMIARREPRHQDKLAFGLLRPRSGRSAGRGSASGRRTSASRGCASRRCSRSASFSCTSRWTTGTSTRAS